MRKLHRIYSNIYASFMNEACWGGTTQHMTQQPQHSVWVEKNNPAFFSVFYFSLSTLQHGFFVVIWERYQWFLSVNCVVFLPNADWVLTPSWWLMFLWRSCCCLAWLISWRRNPLALLINHVFRGRSWAQFGFNGVCSLWKLAASPYFVVWLRFQDLIGNYLRIRFGKSSLRRGNTC